MKKQWISHLLKVFIILFILLSIFFIIDVIPLSAQQYAWASPELVHLQIPMLVITESLMVLFVIGLLVILYLLRLYDGDLHFSLKFLKGLRLLIGLCVIALAAIFVTGLIILFNNIAGPGEAIIIIFSFLLVGTVTSVIALIETIVAKTIEYKNEMDMVI